MANTSPTLAEICRKVEDGERLSAAEGAFLYRDDVDLHAVGELADALRRRKHHDLVYYNVNAHLNATNICVYRCTLCAYSCDEDDPRAYVLDDDAILARGQEAVDRGCTELHIVGGAHPTMPYEWYLGIIRQLHEAFPSLHLKAWTAVEIDWFSHIGKRSVGRVLEEMRQAGLGSLPGGGAEIFDPDVRAQICPRKANAQTWLNVHRRAHELGLRSNATMLFGHVESVEHRIDHLVRLRRLQDQTGGFQAFIPLAFHPENTAFAHLSRPTAMLDLRTVAVSRLMLDNIDHIKAYWISLGLGTAQTALAYGADDLDGTVVEEKIHHEAGADSPEGLTVEQLQAIIREAGREPVERDTLYRCVQRQGRRWWVES